jgi:hypothetical protein
MVRLAAVALLLLAGRLMAAEVDSARLDALPVEVARPWSEYRSRPSVIRPSSFDTMSARMRSSGLVYPSRLGGSGQMSAVPLATVAPA